MCKPLGCASVTHPNNLEVGLVSRHTLGLGQRQGQADDRVDTTSCPRAAAQTGEKSGALEKVIYKEQIKKVMTIQRDDQIWSEGRTR